MWEDFPTDVQNEIIIRCPFKLRCLNRYWKQIREDYEIDNPLPLIMNIDDICQYFVENEANMQLGSNISFNFFDKENKVVLDDNEYKESKFSHSIHELGYHKTNLNIARFNLFYNRCLIPKLKSMISEDFIPDINIIKCKVNRDSLNKILGKRYKNNLFRVTVENYLIKLRYLIENNISKYNEDDCIKHLEFNEYIL